MMQMAAVELTQAGTLFHTNSQFSLKRLWRFCVQKIEIGQYLLKLSQNFVGVQFFEPQCSYEYFCTQALIKSHL